MSEGGQLPWKRQTTRSAPTANYGDLLSPLPEPPSGVTWVRGENESGGREWYLVDTREDIASNGTSIDGAVAVVISENVNPNNNNGGEVPVVILKPDEGTSVTPPSQLTPSAVVVNAQEEQGTKDSKSKAPATVDTGLSAAEGTLEMQSLPRARLVNDMHQVSNTSSVEVASLATATAAVATSSAKIRNLRDHKSGESISDEKRHPKYGEYQVDYTEHVVLPTDTLAGLCLAYKISRRELQRANHFFGESLQLAPSTLIIPITKKARQVGWQPQNKNSRDFQMAALGAECPTLSHSEVKCYLETNTWNLQQAIDEATQDLEWEKQNQAEIERHEQLHQKVDRTLTASSSSSASSDFANGHNNAFQDDDNCCQAFCQGLGLRFLLPSRAAIYAEVESN